MLQIRHKLNKILFLMSSLLVSSICFAVPSIEGIQVYQKASPLTREHTQNLAEDIHRFQNADDLWDELRDGFTLPHYEDNPLVQQKIQWFMNHQDYLIRSVNRAAPFLYFISQQIKRRNLPSELVLLPIIESAYNPFAYSTAGAAGIWQMMPNTASGYGIRQNWWYDGRRDVIASTKAALNHLYYLQSFFEGNWLLAIAAYNTGEGNVIAAIRKNIRNGDNTDYWSLPLAQETRDYVPQLLALAEIISHPETYPINFPQIQNAPYLAQVDVGEQIDLKHAAELAGMSMKSLMQLNPGYNRAATDPNGPYKIVLPIENVSQFTENLSNLPEYAKVHLANYRIRSGDKLKTLARRFNTTPEEIKRANPRLAKNFKPGNNIIIPSTRPAISEAIMEASQPQLTSAAPTMNKKKNKSAFMAKVEHAFDTLQGNYTLQPGDTLYMVRKRDNLQSIATHFRVPVKALASVNKLSNGTVKPGQKLIIPTHIENTTQHYQLTPGDTIYMVRNGDTMENIAEKFHTSAAMIRLANLLSDSELQAGDRLVIPTHA